MEKLNITLPSAICWAVLVLLGICAVPVGNAALAQNPPPQPHPNPNVPSNLSLVPLTLLSVGVDGVAKPLSTPTGATLPTPEFFVPKNATKVFDIITSGGNVKVNFSNSVPAGVPASAFEWVQQTVPAGNAVGQLRYNGCASCPATVTLSITASSNNSVHGQVKLNLTASNGRPVLNGITRNGGDEVEPRFEIRFQSSTFDPSDSQIVGTYSSGLRYRLIPSTGSQFAQGRMNVIIPRLQLDRTVRVTLSNPYGSSASANVTLPEEGVVENPVFEQVNASGEFPNPARVGDTFSVKHTNNGLLEVSGSDEIPIQPLANSSSCNQRDYIFQSARVSWMGNLVQFPEGSRTTTTILPDQPVTTLGAITIASQPPANALLRSPNNRLRVNWTLTGRSGDAFYQVLYRGVIVVGVCDDRVIH